MTAHTALRLASESTHMKKKLLFVLILMTCNYASAQQPIEKLYASLRSICVEMVEKDKVGDMMKSFNVQVEAEKICACATERFTRDPVVQHVATLSTDEIRALPKMPNMPACMTARYYSMSMACYADALSNAADHIDVAP